MPSKVAYKHQLYTHLLATATNWLNMFAAAALKQQQEKEKKFPMKKKKLQFQINVTQYTNIIND